MKHVIFIIIVITQRFFSPSPCAFYSFLFSLSFLLFNNIVKRWCACVSRRPQAARIFLITFAHYSAIKWLNRLLKNPFLSLAACILHPNAAVKKCPHHYINIYELSADDKKKKADVMGKNCLILIPTRPFIKHYNPVISRLEKRKTREKGDREKPV